MFRFKRYPPLQELIRTTSIQRVLDPPLETLTGLTWSSWAGTYLDVVGKSLSAVLTTRETAALGTVYLDLVPTVFEFNAQTCAVEDGMLILLPQGIFLLGLLNAYLYQALNCLEKLAVVTNRSTDWQTHFRAHLALRRFGERGSFDGVDVNIRKVVRSCIKAVAEFDSVLRVATRGVDAYVEELPKGRLPAECWGISDCITPIQWRFVVAHELAHILAGDCTRQASSVPLPIPGHPGLRAFQFALAEQELRADLWAAKALRRNSSRKEISLPIDLFCFLMHCLDETTYFFSCKAAIEAGQLSPPRTTGHHPDATARRQGLARIIGRFDGWSGWNYLFELVSARQQHELRLISPRSASPTSNT